MTEKFDIFPKQSSPELVKAREAKDRTWERYIHTNPNDPEFPVIKNQYLNSLYHWEAMMAKESLNGY